MGAREGLAPVSAEEKPGARDAIVPPSYSSPTLAPEALELFEAFRADVKGVRDDLVEGLEGVKQEIHASNERLAGHTLAVYKLTEQRLDAHGREARAHRAEFVAFAADSRHFQTSALVALKNLQGQGQTEKRTLHLAVTWIALRTGWNPETTRLFLVAFAAAVFASTLTACLAHAEILR